MTRRPTGALAGPDAARRPDSRRATAELTLTTPRPDAARGGREGSLEAPTRHPIDWRNPAVLRRSRARKELERVFDICHGCRRCFSLCNSFPTLFDAVDESPTGEVDGVDKKVFWEVVDHCYLCDMCFMTKCPYVPPHPWNVDFPHLMLRAKAVHARKSGIELPQSRRWQHGHGRQASRASRSSPRSSTPSTAPRPAARCWRRRSASTATRRIPKYHSRTARKRLAAWARRMPAQAAVRTVRPTEQTTRQGCAVHDLLWQSQRAGSSTRISWRCSSTTAFR